MKFSQIVKTGVSFTVAIAMSVSSWANGAPVAPTTQESNVLEASTAPLQFEVAGAESAQLENAGGGAFLGAGLLPLLIGAVVVTTIVVAADDDTN